MIRRPPRSTPFPTRRSSDLEIETMAAAGRIVAETLALVARQVRPGVSTEQLDRAAEEFIDRKSTRLNSSHLVISYAVFCLKKKKAPSSSALRAARTAGTSVP